MVTSILVALVAVLHLGFLVIEMFLWDHPFGRKRFKMTSEYAKASAALAASQGLYNGFLAAGLIWGLIVDLASIQIFFLICVVIAGFSAVSRLSVPSYTCKPLALAAVCLSG